MNEELKKWFNGQFGILKTRILRFKVVGMDPKIAKRYYFDVGYFLDKDKNIRNVPNGMYVERPILDNTGIQIVIFNQKLANVESVTAFLEKCGLEVVLIDDKIRRQRRFFGISCSFGRD